MSRLYELIEHYHRKLPGAGEVEAVIGPAAALAYYLIRAPAFSGYDETLNAIRTSTGKVAAIEWIRAYKTRTGDGGRVLQAALDDFARKGVSRVFLLPVADELQGARIRFFERHGFRTLDLDAKKPKRPMARGNPLGQWVQVWQPSSMTEVEPPLRVAYRKGAKDQFEKTYAKIPETIHVVLGGEFREAPSAVDKSRLNKKDWIAHIPRSLREVVSTVSEESYQKFLGEKRGSPNKPAPFTPFTVLHRLADGYIGTMLTAFTQEQVEAFEPPPAYYDLSRMMDVAEVLFEVSLRFNAPVVDTAAGREMLLLDETNLVADLFAKYVLTGKVALTKELERIFWPEKLRYITEILEEGLQSMRENMHLLQGSMTPMRNNRTDLAGRHVPEKYLEGLPPDLQRQRLAELTESRDAYNRGEFGELPTDKKARELGLVKLSAYRMVAMERGFDISQVNDLRDMATKALRYYGFTKGNKKVVDDLTSGLEKVYQKGLAAWQSGGHRPGATGQNWADARVASVLVGGKAAWTADNKQFNLLPTEVRAKVIQQLPDVYAALRAQGREHDVSYIQSAASNPKHVSAFYAASSIYRWPFGLQDNEKGYPRPYSPQNPINRPWEYLK